MEEEVFTHSFFPNSTVILSFVNLRWAQLYVSLVLNFHMKQRNTRFLFNTTKSSIPYNTSHNTTKTQKGQEVRWQTGEKLDASCRCFGWFQEILLGQKLCSTPTLGCQSSTTTLWLTDRGYWDQKQRQKPWRGIPPFGVKTLFQHFTCVEDRAHQADSDLFAARPPTAPRKQNGCAQQGSSRCWLANTITNTEYSPIPLLPILNTSGNQWYWSNTNTTLDERVPPSVVLACSSSIAEIWWQLLKCWAKLMWTLSRQGWR